MVLTCFKKYNWWANIRYLSAFSHLSLSSVSIFDGKKFNFGDKVVNLVLFTIISKRVPRSLPLIPSDERSHLPTDLSCFYLSKIHTRHSWFLNILLWNSIHDKFTEEIYRLLYLVSHDYSVRLFWKTLVNPHFSLLLLSVDLTGMFHFYHPCWFNLIISSLAYYFILSLSHLVV